MHVLSEDFLKLDYESIIEKITEFISDEVKSRKKSGVVIGLSGGLDSSVCVVLASRALHRSKIIGLIMPEKGLTPKTDIQNAKTLAKKLSIRYKEIHIERGKKILLNRLPKHRLSAGNFSARLRMSLLYYYAAVHNLLVLGTADKSELMIGYFTKFGDAGADMFPIGELYKSQVKLLARELQLPEEIIRQPSSPRFWKRQLAEREIGLPYADIDKILDSYLNNDLKDCELNKKKIKIVTEMINNSQHKKEDVPICNPL
jgi:NAD+ synthase